MTLSTDEKMVLSLLGRDIFPVSSKDLRAKINRFGMTTSHIFSVLGSLADKGLVKRYRSRYGRFDGGKLTYYHLTEKGFSHKKKILPKSSPQIAQDNLVVVAV